MKMAVLGFASFLAGLTFVMAASVVFTYTTMYQNLSFALKNGIYQSSLTAMIPEIVCEWQENPAYDPEVDEEEAALNEVCEEVYLTKEEYYELLEESVIAYKQGAYVMELALMDYQPDPFLARATLQAEMHHGFLHFAITVDELVLEHD